MTTSDWKKAFVQLEKKPNKLKKYIKHCAPKKRSVGAALKHCLRCGRTSGHIGKYGIHLCRNCFYEIAEDLGFKHYD